MISRGQNIENFGRNLAIFLKEVILNRNNFVEPTPSFFDAIICHGYSEFFKTIPKGQQFNLSEYLLTWYENQSTAKKTESDKDLDKNFKVKLEENYFRLNIYEFFSGNAKDFTADPYHEYPQMLKKNFWNLVLFSRDVEAIENLPLHLMSHSDYSYKENAMEIFFYGKHNNFVTEEETINCVKKLTSFGFGFNQNLKLGSRDELRKKIENSLSKEGFAKVEKAINFVSDFETELLDFVMSKQENQKFYDKINQYLDLYEGHVKTKSENIDCVIPTKKTSLVNFLSPIGFLTHLTSTGFIDHISSINNKPCKNILQRIDGLISNIDEKSKIFEEKIKRDSERSMKSLMTSDSSEKKPAKQSKSLGLETELAMQRYDQQNLERLKQEKLQKQLKQSEEERLKKQAQEEKQRKEDEESQLIKKAQDKLKREEEERLKQLEELRQKKIEEERLKQLELKSIEELSEVLTQKITQEVVDDITNRNIEKMDYEDSMKKKLQFYQIIKIRDKTLSSCNVYLTKSFISHYSGDYKAVSSTEMLGEIIKNEESITTKKQFLELMSDNLRLMLQIFDDNAEFNLLS